MISIATAAPVVGASFLASTVEIVEAFTIVLAVSVVRGLRPAILGTAAALLWIATFQLCFVRPLRSHLLHDRDVNQGLLVLQKLARRGRPRPQFYLAMLLALGSMILLIFRSLRS